ncbi:BrnT family toxin [Pseudomonadota bacterium]
MHTIKTEITWDSVKAKSNRLKHRVFFSEVEPVFYDPNAISFEDKESENEARFIVIGLDSLARLVVVAYAYRDSVIRIISARKASKAEQKVYEKGIRF